MVSSDYTEGIRDFYLGFANYVGGIFRDCWLGVSVFMLSRREQSPEIQKILDNLPYIADLMKQNKEAFIQYKSEVNWKSRRAYEEHILEIAERLVDLNEEDEIRIKGLLEDKRREKKEKKDLEQMNREYGEALPPDISNKLRDVWEPDTDSHEDYFRTFSDSSDINKD